MSPLANTSESSSSDILRVIWARGKARAERWTEEVAIVLEEMRRSLAYCEWKSTWWMNQRESRTGTSDLLEGLAAYSLKQAKMWRSMGESFATEWAPVVHDFKLPSDWPPPYCERLPGHVQRVSAHDRNWVARVGDALGLLSRWGDSERRNYDVDICSSSDSD